MAPLRIGLAGFGIVGSGVWKHLHAQAALLTQRSGRELRLTQVATRTPAKAAAAGVPEQILTAHWRDLVTNPELDVIVELMGGLTEADELVRAALNAGKHVVTANKALLAEQGESLFKLAGKQGRRILFEASVAGGIPLIKSLREGLVANRILTLHGIINGTCNYMLTQMSERGLEYAPVLAEAKQLGYAEADERLDVEGHDTAHKAVVLARLAYGFWPKLSEVYTQGIVGLERQDVVFAQKLGYEVKLLAVIKAENAQEPEVRVHPTLVPRSHVLASVTGVFNAVMVRGDVVGDTLFYGRGAGRDATSSAVLSDLVDLARSPVTPVADMRCCELTKVRIKPMSEVVSRYYLRLMVEDAPGVLAQVATVLGRRKIGISSVIQPEGHAGEVVPLIIMVHDAVEKEFHAAREEMEKLAVVRAPAIWLRVEDFA